MLTDKTGRAVLAGLCLIPGVGYVSCAAVGLGLAGFGGLALFGNDWAKDVLENLTDKFGDDVANDDDYCPDCHLVDIFVYAVASHRDSGGVTHTGLVIGCFYRCTDGTYVTRKHYVATGFEPYFIGHPERMRTFCPATIKKY